MLSSSRSLSSPVNGVCSPARKVINSGGWKVHELARKSSRKPGKATKRGGRATPSSKLSPIPAGFRSVTPYLAIDGAARAIEFYKKAFGAKELTRQATPDGKIMNASVKIGDSIVMMSDVFPGSAKSPNALGGSPVTLHIYSKDVDGLWQTALSAGARVIMPLDNQFWGERYGQLADPFGHRWSVSMQVKMSREEMDAKQKEAMAVFAQSEHTGFAEQPSQG